MLTIIRPEYRAAAREPPPYTLSHLISRISWNGQNQKTGPASGSLSAPPCEYDRGGCRQESDVRPRKCERCTRTGRSVWSKSRQRQNVCLSRVTAPRRVQTVPRAASTARRGTLDHTGLTDQDSQAARARASLPEAASSAMRAKNRRPAQPNLGPTAPPRSGDHFDADAARRRGYVRRHPVTSH
jgi:hypothetical protein